MRSVASQNTGIDSPNRPNSRAVKSMARLRKSADTIPSGTAITIDNSTARTASSMVTGTRCTSISRTGRLERSDTPSSRRTRSPSHFRYWSGSGASRPRSWRSDARASAESEPSSPMSWSTTSPGRSRIRTKMISVEPRNIGITSDSRAAT